jgi:hypothetical protein
MVCFLCASRNACEDPILVFLLSSPAVAMDSEAGHPKDAGVRFQEAFDNKEKVMQGIESNIDGI